MKYLSVWFSLFNSKFSRMSSPSAWVLIVVLVRWVTSGLKKEEV